MGLIGSRIFETCGGGTHAVTTRNTAKLAPAGERAFFAYERILATFVSIITPTESRVMKRGHVSA
jgi:hypothetical protein